MIQRLRTKADRDKLYVDTYIVDPARDAFQILKERKSKQQRQHFRIGVKIFAPTPADFGDSSGMGKKVADRFDLNRNSPAFTESIAERSEIDSEYASQQIAEARGFTVGDLVSCRHGEGVLQKLDDDGSCAVTISIGGVSKTSEFTKPGREKGGARLRMPIHD